MIFFLAERVCDNKKEIDRKRQKRYERRVEKCGDVFVFDCGVMVNRKIFSRTGEILPLY